MNSKEQTTNGSTKEVDVLYAMFVAAAVFHLEMSPLNADAPENTVEVNAMVVQIQKRNIGKT